MPLGRDMQKKINLYFVTFIYLFGCVWHTGSSTGDSLVVAYGLGCSVACVILVPQQGTENVSPS